jgi:FkbH-like protein
MYESDWASGQSWAKESSGTGIAPPFRTRLSRGEVARTMLLMWSEHCLECAPPQCYASCPLYVSRADRKCARLVYGMQRNPAFSGLLDYGIDLRFRRWGKIEAGMYNASVSVGRHRSLARMDDVGVAAARVSSDVLLPVSPTRKAHGAFNVLRHKLLHRVRSEGPAGDYDEFVLECYSPDPEPFRLVLEARPNGITRFRHAFEIEPGHNFHRLPMSTFPAREEGVPNLLSIFPENDRPARLIFTWLDFVKYRQSTRPAVEQPGSKVKCLVWDLDNTLWPGTLMESAPEKLTIPPATIDLIRQLDQRGILQSIASKNDHEAAWAVIARHGLADYFLFPAINWGQKSAAIRQIAQRLNIGLDSLALVDDSPFERAEVRAALPMVRTYDEGQLAGLLALGEFDVPITSQSKIRRQSYLLEMQRERAREIHTGNYSDFLRACGMKMRIFSPTSDSDQNRCLELIQRSNQLNLSSRRYSAKEFDVLLKTPGVLSLALHCADRFGDYGIVGFASVDENGEVPTAGDFVISCRVAQKQVEHAFFRWLAGREQKRGRSMLRARLVVTQRNGPLVRVFDELPFKRVAENGNGVRLEAEVQSLLPAEDIIEIIDETT